MGIKNLNRFFLDNCTDRSIKKMDIKELSGKSIAIDISIYLYKYVEKDALIENLYLMVEKFRYNNIRPVFIFDGKPPTEKMELIEKRKQDKNIAEEKFNQLKNKLDEVQDNQLKSEEIKQEMDILKRQFVRIKHSHIQDAKLLLDALGVFYMESRGEADHLCAFLAKHEYVWACMSDDMDMFLLDCPRVLRHLSLLNDTVMFYDTSAILRELNMTYTDFKYILLISGTDYNVGDDVPHLYDIVEMYCEYRNEMRNKSKLVECVGVGGGGGDVRKCTDTFANWYSNRIGACVDKNKIRQLCLMYNLSVFALRHNEELHQVILAYPFHYMPIKKDELNKILDEDGFIFVE